MLEPLTATSVLCAAAAAVDIIALVILIMQSSENLRSKYLIGADVLHVTVTQEIIYFDWLSRNGVNSAGTETGRVYVTVVRWIILILIAMCAFSDRDGRLTVKSRQEPLDVQLIICAFWPVIAGVMAKIIITAFSIDEFCLAVSFLLSAMVLQRERWRDIGRREETLNIRQAKLLTEQMSPHFIFNSLSSIQYLIYSDPESAGRCLEDFTGYLRGNIDALTSENPIPFSEELEHIKQYISLTRAGSAIGFTVDFQLSEREFLIPALTVQPIVENAVKHGALSRRDGSGHVLVRTERIGMIIRITVEDNGVGVSMTENQRLHQSVGFSSAQSRLETQCGGTLHIQRDEKGSRAVITIPLKEGDRNAHLDS